MNGIINWLKSNKAFVITLTLYGDPKYHLDIFREDNSGEDAIAPFQQWIFSEPEMAQRAAQAICEAVIQKGKKAGSTITVNPRPEVAKSSQDIVLCLELDDDEDDTTQYRLYITAFEHKPSGEWI